MQTGKDKQSLESDLEFYQRCHQIIKPLLIHVNSSNLSEDMIKQFLLKGVQRIERWITEEIRNIEKLQKRKNEF